jgi:NodT family efflux transporter outer membrane factor (OMF) lipoprotein
MEPGGRGIALTALLLLSACAVGPDFHRPAPPSVSGFTPASAPKPSEATDAQKIVQGMDIPGQWWTLFHSEALDALVKQAITNNADVAAAEAALRQAQEQLYAQRGAYLPSLGAQFNALRARNPATIAPPLASNATYYSLLTPQVAVSYTPDVFGGVHRNVEGAAARAEQQKFQTQAVYLTLTSNVVQAALQEASLREQIVSTREILASETRILQLMQQQHAAGQISGADVAAQQTALAQAEQSLPPLQKQLAQEQDLLAVLGGRFPAEGPSGTIEISKLELPLQVPVGLPSALVERRPDIRAAEANLHAASAAVGVAAAARLPVITLTANAGSSAETLAGLGSSPNLFWTLAGGVVQPIFQGGTLLHQQRAAEAAYDEAREQYRSTVLQAFQNVADTLQALQLDDESLRAAMRAEEASSRALAIAQKQVQLGETSALSVLNAEQAFHQASIALIQARTARFTDTVALFQALGAGDWKTS